MIHPFIVSSSPQGNTSTADETARNSRIERTLSHVINEYNTCAGKDEKQLLRMCIRAALRIEFNVNCEWYWR